MRFKSNTVTFYKVIEESTRHSLSIQDAFIIHVQYVYICVRTYVKVICTLCTNMFL